MKRSAALLSLALLAMVLLGSCSRKAPSHPPGRLHDPRGFSYDPPPGWQIRDVKFGSLHSLQAHGDRAGMFEPSITVIYGPEDGSVEKLMERNLAAMHPLTYKEMTVLSRGSFTTDFGVSGARVATQEVDPFANIHVRIVSYCFMTDGHGHYFVTCSNVATDGNAHDAEFDAAMKSFRLH